MFLYGRDILRDNKKRVKVDEEVSVLFLVDFSKDQIQIGIATNRCLCERLAAKGVVDLGLPATLYSSQNIFIWHIFDLCLVVVARIVFEDDTDDFVLRASEPSLFLVFQYDLYLSFCACNKARICDGDAEGSYSD